MKKHEWRERTDEGEVRLVTATRHAREWKLSSRLKSEEEWTHHDPPELDDLHQLREILVGKSQRRRVPLEQIAEIDKLIAKREKPRRQ